MTKSFKGRLEQDSIFDGWHSNPVGNMVQISSYRDFLFQFQTIYLSGNRETFSQYKSM